MIVVTMSSWLAKLSRKKPLEPNSTASLLERCLGTLDLTLLGVGSMVGSGIYIMTGIAAKEQAGICHFAFLQTENITSTVLRVCITTSFVLFVYKYAHNNSSTNVHIFLSNHPTIFSFICKPILTMFLFYF